MQDVEKGAAIDLEDKRIAGPGEAVCQGIAGGFRILNQIEKGIIELTRDTAVDLIKAAGCVTEQTVCTTRDVLKGTIGAAEETGEKLAGSTGAITRGLVAGMSCVCESAIGVLNWTARTTVRGVSDIGSCVAVVAKKAVDGVVDSTRDIGVKLGNAAKETRDGIPELAASIGGTTAKAIEGVFSRAVKAVTDAVQSKEGAVGTEGAPVQCMDVPSVQLEPSGVVAPPEKKESI